MTQQSRKNSFIRLLVILPLLVLVGVIVAGNRNRTGLAPQKRHRPAIGEKARDFSFPDLQGKTVRLSDYLGKKVVMINIWATWCTECRKELPTVQHLYEKFRGRDFEVVSVSIDAGGGRVVKPFMHELGLTFPALLDTAGSIQYLYGTSGVPETYIVDRQGRIAYVEIGAGDWSTPSKEELIRGLVEEDGGMKP